MLEQVFCAPRPFLKGRGQQRERAFHGVFDLLHRPVGIKPRQIAGQRTCGRRNGHVIVIEDDKHPPPQMAGIVQRLERHAGADGAIADNGNRIAQRGIGRAAKLARHGKAQRGRDGGGTMRRAKGIIGRFRAFGETRQAVFLAQGANTVAPPCQNFMGVALVRYIPDQPVARGIEHGMKRHCQFHHAQARTQMAAGFGHSGNGFRAQFIRQLPQFAVAEGFHIGGAVHPVQNGRLRHGFTFRVACACVRFDGR